MSLFAYKFFDKKYLRIPIHRVCGGWRPSTIRIGDYMIIIMKGSRGGRWVKRTEVLK